MPRVKAPKPALAKKETTDNTATPVAETRTYWLSFADTEDGHNLGVIITTINKEDADAALLKFPTMFDKNEGPWVVAAVMKSHRLKICPGGEVAAYRLGPAKEFEQVKPYYTLDKLLSKTDIDNATLRAREALDQPSIGGGVEVKGEDDGI